MDQLIEIGRKRTILISISIILLSFWSIYFEQTSNSEIDYAKLVRQIIRLILTAGLLYLVYIGKNWARILMIIFSTLAILLSIGALIGLNVDLMFKIPFLTMILVYTLTIYHFSFAKSFKAFWNSQKINN